MDEDRRWIDRHEALTRLGVKAQTLYAYVSRGRIAARPDPAHPRRSLYAAADVARLCGADTQDAATARPAQGAAARGEADLTSSVSLFAGGRLFYRGLDAIQLAEQATVEDVARRLWDARPDDCFAGLKPRIDPIVGGATRRRILAVLGRRLTEDRSMRAHDVPSLKREAGALLNEVVDSVSGPGPRLYFHQRLARGLKAPERDSHLLRRALILGAEAGLSDAVLATRTAAAGGAPLAGAVLAGLTTLEGSVLGALDDVVAYVGEARRDPEEAARRWIALRGSPPGFGGWNVTPDDPRAAALLKAADLGDELAAIRTEGERASGRKADFGLALALISRRLELGPTGAGDLLMLGRLIGLIAHALDQVIDGSPIRARMRYVGPGTGRELIPVFSGIFMSDWLAAIILGLVEGLTEFIPVSSTGHMLLLGHFMGFESAGKTFEIVIQLGALLAIVSVYFRRLWTLATRWPFDPEARRFLIGLLVAFAPAVVIGFLAYDFIKTVLFETPQVICVALIVGGVILLALDRMDKRPRWLDASAYPMRVYFLIGLFQCLAMIPGVSRSGATIAGGLLLKTDKRSAAEFSFFLALPTMGAAVAYDLFKNRAVLDFSDIGLIVVGFLVAFVSALAVVRFLLDFVSRRGFAPFAWWRIVVGVAGLALLQAGF